MKLISEFVENDIECIVEASKRMARRTMSLKVYSLQADKKNRNGRIYPKPIMEKAVNTYVENQVSKKRAVGELNHPEGPTVNLDKVSHLITDLKFEGNDVVGKRANIGHPNGSDSERSLRGRCSTRCVNSWNGKS